MVYKLLYMNVMSGSGFDFFEEFREENNLESFSEFDLIWGFLKSTQ